MSGPHPVGLPISYAQLRAGVCQLHSGNIPGTTVDFWRRQPTCVNLRHLLSGPLGVRRFQLRRPFDSQIRPAFRRALENASTLSADQVVAGESDGSGQLGLTFTASF